MAQPRPGNRRWSVDAQIDVAPREDEDHELRFADAATMHYPEAWTPAQCAAAFLRNMADEIEKGDLPGEAVDREGEWKA